MNIKQIIKDIAHEINVLTGKADKDKKYASHRQFPDEETARQAFADSKARLFHVEQWSELPGLASRFELYNHRGEAYSAERPRVGDFIRILLPVPSPENWVEVTDIQEQEDVAEFTVHPAQDPRDSEKDVEHFFVDEASSTFRVERQGSVIYAFEIGKNEGINNQGEEAGTRNVLNTLIAEGGWMVFQEMQWKKLTRYLVHEPVERG